MGNSVTTRVSAFKHKEAYCRMTYTCKECGHSERVWNGRDGVTPFLIKCSKCNANNGMRHVNWQEDSCMPLFQPQKGERYFVHRTRQRAKELAVSNTDDLISSGLFEIKERNSIIIRLFNSYYGQGEFLELLEVEV